MSEKTRHIKNFLFSQHLADGIRITIEIVLPAIVYAQLGKIETGITISLGALCVSISDAPGPVKHKRNGMLYCNIFIFLMALLTGVVNNNIYILGLLIGFSSFFFSMFSVYGNRATSIGTAALLIMILRLTNITDTINAVNESLLILCGGIWYMLVALLFYRIMPYRPAQRSLGECIHETANYLRIKSELYDTNKNPDDEYKKLVAQQVVVNEKQEQVREHLFKNRQLLKESIRSGRVLVLTFADLVDLYEHIMASWYDYTSLRKRFSSSGVLDQIAIVIKNIADELDDIGFAIQSNSSYKKKYDVVPDLIKLKSAIDNAGESNISVLILKKILVNLRNIGERVDGLSEYFGNTLSARKMRNDNDYSKFVTHQKIDVTTFKNNLTLQSSVFRHSLRMMVTCIIGYIISKFLPNGHHSYWLLLTIIVILKPGFSLTKQRNYERFTGTIAGGLIGLILLAFIHDRNILLIIIVFFMIGTYTFQRLNYIVMVIFMTPYILTLFNLLGIGFINVAEERLLDTGIGSLLSFMASYLLFPHWESGQLDNYMSSVLKANINYMYTLADFVSGEKKSVLNYKLIRKEIFVSTANLSGAFNRMLSEPKSKQRRGNEIYEFVVLNNVLSSNMAGLIDDIAANKNVPDQKEAQQYIKQSIYKLRNSLLRLDKNFLPGTEEIKIAESYKLKRKNDSQLSEQFDFIYKLTNKINKATIIIANQP
ncbi:MAG TPA: FUSC family membrane protein [Ginsengibacter sp.]